MENKAQHSFNQDELAAINEIVAHLSPEDKNLLAAIQESPYRLTTLEQFQEFPQNTEFFTLEPNIKRLDDLGWSYFEQHADIPLTTALREALDPILFGTHAMEEDRPAGRFPRSFSVCIRCGGASSGRQGHRPLL